jgi:hypothetical protein
MAVEAMAIDTANTKRSRGPRMSLELASHLFDWSSIALAFGACIVFVATAAIVWLGIAKEHHWDVLREHANEKIAAVGLEAAKANAELGAAQADIAKAHVAIAEANARASEANQKANEADLARKAIEEKLLVPRWLTGEQQVDIRSRLAKFPGMIVHLWVYPAGTPDSFALSMLLSLLMKNEGWTTASWTVLSGFPSQGGVAVTWREGSDANKEAAQNLVAGLNAAGIGAIAPGPFEANDETIGPQFPAVPLDSATTATPPTIRIFIGTKTGEFR